MEIREAIIHALDGDAIFYWFWFSLGAINEGNKKSRQQLHLHINY